MNTVIKGRFAPSPSGYLHMGNLLSSLLAWLDARTLGGQMLFRMEDLDPARSEDRYALAMADDLRWLGLDWDEGWPEPDARQSNRTEYYEAAFRQLEQKGLIYPCWCSRAERLAASAPHPGELRDTHCRCYTMTEEEKQQRIRSGRLPAWKLRMPDETVTLRDGHYGNLSQNIAREGGDVIVRRADGVYAYQLAVSVDDMLMGVTRVVRGRDLLESAPRQKKIIELLGGTAPDYAHAPLLLGESHKLSKRSGALNTQSLRRRYTPEELVGLLAFLAGLMDRPEPIAARELVSGFSWDKVSREDIPLPDFLTDEGAEPPDR